MPPVISTFIKDYNIKSVLHTGVNGDVLMAECKSTNQKYVLKKLDEKQMSVELIQNEIAIGENLKHPSIVKYYSSWKEGDNWYIVMEYLEGWDLFSLMEQRGFLPLPEKYTKKIFRKIVKAVKYLHSKNIIHRDLKLENVMLTRNGSIKIIDFGMSEQLQNKNQLSNRWCGSTDYVAPEIVLRIPYSGFKVDVWCLGVMVYTLLYSEFPFLWQERVNSYHNGTAHPTPDYPESITISNEARDLLEKMMSLDPSKRLSLHEVAAHPWLHRRSPKARILAFFRK